MGFLKTICNQLSTLGYTCNTSILHLRKKCLHRLIISTFQKSANKPKLIEASQCCLEICFPKIIHYPSIKGCVVICRISPHFRRSRIIKRAKPDKRRIRARNCRIFNSSFVLLNILLYRNLYKLSSYVKMRTKK